MRILTANYNDRQYIVKGLRAMLESIATEYGILENIDLVFIGRTSTLNEMDCKAKGVPVTPLTFPDAMIIEARSHIKGANVRLTVANEFGNRYRRNNPADISIAEYHTVISALKRSIDKQLTLIENQEEIINE
ncbi:MAG: hypothetical protein ACRCX2_06180 [Paraclostridium sp.]